MQYDIKLRPHHVKALFNFVEKKKFLLSDEDYLSEFQERNKGYHNDKFIIYWKHFLEKLSQKPSLKFIYLNDFDSVCDNCDIRKECEIQNSKLQILVKRLDDNSLNEIPLKEGEVYTIQYLIDTMSQK